MILSKSRDLCFPAFAVVRPNAIQVVLVNSAVLGWLPFLLDPTHKFPHRSGKWFSKLCPASRLSNADEDAVNRDSDLQVLILERPLSERRSDRKYLRL